MTESWRDESSDPLVRLEARVTALEVICREREGIVADRLDCLEAHVARLDNPTAPVPHGWYPYPAPLVAAGGCGGGIGGGMVAGARSVSPAPSAITDDTTLMGMQGYRTPPIGQWPHELAPDGADRHDKPTPSAIADEMVRAAEVEFYRDHRTNMRDAIQAAWDVMINSLQR